MQRIDKLISFILPMCLMAGTSHGQAVPAARAAAPAPAASAARSNTGMPATIAEMVRLEAEKALEDARKAAQASAPVPVAPPVALSTRPVAVVNADVIELLGTLSRSGKFSADLAINGAVRLVREGDVFGAYQVTGIAGSCIHLMKSKKEKILRCFFADNN